MPFKWGNPGCPCCSYNLFPCDCPNGGASRKFIGTPTLVVTISDLPSIISFETLYQTGGIPQNFWTTVTIEDLNIYNGTYAWPMSKTEGGCLVFNSSNDRSQTGLPTHPVNLVQRLRNSFADCTLVGAPNNVNRNETLALDSNYITAPHQDTFQVAFRIDGYHSTGTSTKIYEITGTQRMVCSKNFDPLEDELTASMGSGLGGFNYYPKDQNIYLVYASDSVGRCVSPEARTLHQIGKITAEFIDDVP